MTDTEDQIHRQALDEAALSALFDRLFPLMRSITGPGLRQSMEMLAAFMPLEITTVPSGTQVFDWTVPPEWCFRSARLTGPDGAVIVDTADSTLHVVNYSEPIARTLSLAELQPHLYSLPELPEAIPYVTSYYKRSWGFCLPHRQRQTLPEGNYRAVIDSDFKEGSVPLAQTLLPGDSEEEILLTAYLCHPSMANNELSGPLALVALYDRLRAWPRRRYSYRFLLNPETIGALCYLHRYRIEREKTLLAGMVINRIGGPAPHLCYKLSRHGDSLIDRVMQGFANKEVGQARLPVEILPFDPRGGSDERQYGSPGINWPVGQAARTIEYQGYHNSLDDKDFMGIGHVLRSVDALEDILRIVEISGSYERSNPCGEPQLSRRNLYPSVNNPGAPGLSSDGQNDKRQMLERILVILNRSDGDSRMIDVAKAYGYDIRSFDVPLNVLIRECLIRPKSILK